MTKAECLAAATPPSLTPGAIVRVGKFFRNLEPKSLKLFVPGEGAPPAHGWRVIPHEWSWQIRDLIGLSVNLEACVRCSRCSIMLHNDPSRFRHVVRLDLAELATLLEMDIVAEYSPIEAIPNGEANPCHFDLLYTKGSIDDLIQSLRAIDTKLKKITDFGPQDDLRLRYARAFELITEAHTTAPVSTAASQVHA